MTVRWIVSVAMALLLPIALQAQARTGDRLRVGLTLSGEVIGTLVEATPTALILDQNGIPIAVPRSRIGVIDRSLGVHDDFGRNALVSIGVSALLVGGAMALMTDPSEPCDMFCGRRTAFVLGATGGGIMGIPIGLIAGIASVGERWERVALPSAADVTLTIRTFPRGGLGFGLRMPMGDM